MHTLQTAMMQDEQVEAAFEDLEVGQQVEAVYAGPVAQSYPTQGNAQSIAILEGPDNAETSATLSFELTVEGEPPPNAMFSGFIPAEGGIYAPLTDVIKDFGSVKIDGDKTFSASVSFEGDGGSDNNGGSGNSGSGSGPGGISTLPFTGGILPIAGIAGALLISGGLLIRRLAR